MIRSKYKKRSDASKQGAEGASDAWVELNSFAVEGLDGLAVGDKVVIVAWLHRGRRNVFKVYTRSGPEPPAHWSLCDKAKNPRQSWV